MKISSKAKIVIDSVRVANEIKENLLLALEKNEILPNKCQLFDMSRDKARRKNYNSASRKRKNFLNRMLHLN